MKDALTDKQRLYVENVARGLDSRAAARAAGYSESFSRVAVHRLGKNPAVAAAIEAIRAEGRKMAVYDLAAAMREADEVCAFAKLHKNAMAYMKATELRAKLSGLLIDRVEIAAVDLTGALARAEARGLDAVNGKGMGSHGSISWLPKIAGAEEAGQADDESGPHLTNASEEL
jgi:hypothetical protein